MFKQVIVAVLWLSLSSVCLAEFTVEQGAAGVAITPSIAYQSANLSLVSPQGRQQLQFAGDQPISIPVPRVDGLYKYELVLQPQLTPLQRQTQADNRANGNETSVFEQSQTHASGSFAVQNGSLLATQTESGSAETDSPTGPAPLPNDQIIADDLIVNGGSLCVGFDCVNGESFGFDSIRLKENNLRIHFNDTSSTASFPGNDWRLLANDTTNGGANLFALEDSTASRRIAVFEAGAPANSLYVNAAGNVGLSSSTPAVELDIVDGDTPTVRLAQDGSSGFGTQTWDVAGNETNFFIRDLTNGSALPFRIIPAAATDDTLIIDSAGQVVIGNAGSTSAAATLHVRSRGTGEPAMLIQNRATPAVDILSLADNGDMILSGTLAQLSRRDSKEHFQLINHQAMLAALRGLDISTWNYKHQDDSERHIGPMAESFFTTYGLGTDPEHIATSDMAAVALASSQALLFEMEGELAAKDQQITALETRLQRVEAMLLQMLDKQQDKDTRPLVSR